MYYLNIGDKKIGPYEAIMMYNLEKQGDILPILYDNASINLSDLKNSYNLCYKKSKSIFGKEIKYADLVNTKTGETFSFQVSNIFLIKIENGDIKMIAKIGDELKYFEDFGKTKLNIESDGDKSELTPLGYFDTFITYDDNYFYPLILNNEKEKLANITAFFDYYGYKSYKDEQGNSHMIMLLEDKKSSETNPIWYFVDNFRIISNKLDFKKSYDYVEKWDLDEDGDIIMEVTSGDNYYLIVPKDNISKSIINFGQKTKIEKRKTIFTFTRFFEDTDFYNIVGKNDNGVFIIDKNKASTNEKEEEKLIYYKSFIKYISKYRLFLMEDFNSEIIILDENGSYIMTTDLKDNDEIESIIKNDNDKILEIKLKGEKEVRKYVI